MHNHLPYLKRIVWVILFLVATTLVYGQQDMGHQQTIDTSGYIQSVTRKSEKLGNKLERATIKVIEKLKKQDDKIISKLKKSDSLAATKMVIIVQSQYAALETKMKNPGPLRTYIPGLDSLTTTLKFLDQTKGLTDGIAKVEALKSELQKAEYIKQFLKERRQQLREQLEKLGFARELKRINKQVYYYAGQINEYKNILNDPKKIEKKALELLSKTKLWKDFFRKNSMLASLFRISNPDEPLTMSSLAGLQTRAQVNGLIQQQIAAGGPNAGQQFQQNLQVAQSQLNELKSRIIKAGGGSSDAEMPEGFKPNDQKTKSFLQRLEYGANLQTQKANSFFPVTSDLGLSLGYKLNSKSVIGIGASYKMGWGRGWNHIAMTHQGLGLRSYVDWKIKGSFWLSGGYEQNYKSVFRDFDQLRDRSGWQQSGLIGLSKQVSVKSKLFKKTKLMLLWDFLSYQQMPRSQPVVFRIGYNLK